jgi:hypothetical protein
MALAGVTDIPEISRTVVPSLFRNSGGWLCDQNTHEVSKSPQIIPWRFRWRIIG